MVAAASAHVVYYSRRPLFVRIVYLASLEITLHTPWTQISRPRPVYPRSTPTDQTSTETSLSQSLRVPFSKNNINELTRLAHVSFGVSTYKYIYNKLKCTSARVCDEYKNKIP